MNVIEIVCYLSYFLRYHCAVLKFGGPLKSELHLDGWKKAMRMLWKITTRNRLVETVHLISWVSPCTTPYHNVLYNTVPYRTIPYNPITYLYHTMPYHDITPYHHAVPYLAAPLCTLWYCTLTYVTVPYVVCMPFIVLILVRLYHHA